MALVLGDAILAHGGVDAHYGLDAIPKRWLKAIDPVIHQRCTRQAADLIALK